MMKKTKEKGTSMERYAERIPKGAPPGGSADLSRGMTGLLLRNIAVIIPKNAGLLTMT